MISMNSSSSNEEQGTRNHEDAEKSASSDKRGKQNVKINDSRIETMEI